MFKYLAALSIFGNVLATVKIHKENLIFNFVTRHYGRCLTV
jgi:hypothetical protein